MELNCCHGNGYDVTIRLTVLPDKRGVKIFIVCLHCEKYFFVIFPRFIRILTITVKPDVLFRAALQTSAATFVF